MDKKPFWRSLTFYGLLFLGVGYAIQWFATGEAPAELAGTISQILQTVGFGFAAGGTVSSSRAPLTLKRTSSSAQE